MQSLVKSIPITYKDDNDRRDNILWCLRMFPEGTTKETLSRITEMDLTKVTKIIDDLVDCKMATDGPDTMKYRSTTPKSSTVVRLIEELEAA